MSNIKRRATVRVKRINVDRRTVGVEVTPVRAVKRKS